MWMSDVCSDAGDSSRDDAASEEISKCCTKLIHLRRELYRDTVDEHVESTPEVDTALQGSNEGFGKGKEPKNVTGHKRRI